jgi:hypothetical protein
VKIRPLAQAPRDARLRSTWATESRPRRQTQSGRSKASRQTLFGQSGSFRQMGPILSVMNSLLRSEGAGEEYNGSSGVPAMLDLAEMLIADLQFADAADVLAKTLVVNGPSVLPLRALARTQRLQGRDRLGLALNNAACDVDSSDLASVCDQAELLLEVRRCHDALAVFAHVSESDLQNGRERAGRARAQRMVNLHAPEVDGVR